MDNLYSFIVKPIKTITENFLAITRGNASDESLVLFPSIICSYSDFYSSRVNMDAYREGGKVSFMYFI